MKTVRWQSANVVLSTGDRRQLWQFKRSGDKAELSGQRTLAGTSPFPRQVVAKTVRDLWQTRVNIAWLPADQVFLRVVQLPPCEPGEIGSMIEFQIEKLSPLPMAQVVWAYEALPRGGEESQTVVVVIAARAAVEQFLGTLEGAGYSPDRLELPALRGLLATPEKGDGVWIHLHSESGRMVALLAWWAAGRLQHLSLKSLATDGAAPGQLAAFLQQIAWTGEVEGWVPEAPRWHLVADASTAALYEPALRELAAHGLDVHDPSPADRLAALSAAAPAPANLIPPEHLTRYRQQFVDRLWMRGLGALGLLYLIAVFAYFVGLNIAQYRKANLERQIANLTASYTNALQLKAKVQILQEQVNLKFAALDCWKAASEALPAELSLTSLTFQRGKKLGLFGTVPADQQRLVTEFNEALGKAAVAGQLLFSQVTTKNIQGAMNQANRPMNWSIECEIRRSDL